MGAHRNRARRACTALVVFLAVHGCAPASTETGDGPRGDAGPATQDAANAARVRSDVQAMMQELARDLAADGPEAWLRYFDDDEAFFMASDGVALFPDINAARDFMADFAPTVATMQLDWGEIRVEPITAEVARLAAPYDETIGFVDGSETTFAGYFTGTAVRRGDGWRLRDLHWSSPTGQ